MKPLLKPLQQLPKDLPMVDQRIEYVRCIMGYPIMAFAGKLGAKLATMESICSGKTEATATIVEAILQIFPFIRRQWLVGGMGEMIQGGMAKVVDEYIYKERSEVISEKDRYDDGIAARIRETRSDLNYNQAVFASKLGVSRNKLVYMETLKTVIDPVFLKKWIMECGLYSEWALFGAGEKYRSRVPMRPMRAIKLKARV